MCPNRVKKKMTNVRKTYFPKFKPRTVFDPTQLHSHAVIKNVIVAFSKVFQVARPHG